MTRYILIPQRQGKTQRITLPMEMLRVKNWLETECYLLVDTGKRTVEVKPYLYDLTEDGFIPAKPNPSSDSLSEGKDDD